MSLWDRVKGWFSGGSRGGGGQVPELAWISAEDNPWGVPVLDLRPVTLGMSSYSENPICAQNAVSFSGEDGTCFIEQVPAEASEWPVALRYRVADELADGVLFTPEVMEHKWALFFFRDRARVDRGRVLCVRSWTRTVQAVAEGTLDGEQLVLDTLRGTIVSDARAEAQARALDFLIRSHALDEIYPAPIEGMEAAPQTAALTCFSLWGNRALYATHHPLPDDPPDDPLRTISLLHIAVARGDLEAIAAQLDRGVSPELRGRDGLTPVHWACAAERWQEVLRLLLERGASVDARSLQGATPLMNAIQARSLEEARFLLGHGADPRAADRRGFTSTHRAAEMGYLEFLELLLEHGADPRVAAEGHTPRSLAEKKGEKAIVERIDRWIASQ
ncbi:MAG: ankyrin repeat domain-containing protein [Myxococcales bacterium]|nr:ankyrin repeat domain-containing protein [Myxococcales bacterium]MCB9755598.1 ankyrin repeat domain-containing protein [Myxococcales bacterium]